MVVVVVAEGPVALPACSKGRGRGGGGGAEGGGILSSSSSSKASVVGFVKG